MANPLERDVERIGETLGALLLPEGVTVDDWTPAIGADTAAHLAKAKGERELALVKALLVSVLIGFFRRGLSSATTSASSSWSGSEESPLNRHQRRAAAKTSATGRRSSSPSPKAPPTGPAPSSAGG